MLTRLLEVAAGLVGPAFGGQAAVPGGPAGQLPELARKLLAVFLALSITVIDGLLSACLQFTAPLQAR